MTLSAFAIGSAAATLVAAIGVFAGFNRERSFYPIILIVVASYNVLFGVIGRNVAATALDGAIFLAFSGLALFGSYRTPWIIVVALAGHGMFDMFHAGLLVSPAVPAWWPSFCAGFDLTVSACVAVCLRNSSRGKVIRMVDC